MPKYPGISPYDNEKGTLGTAKKRWEKLYVKEIESDTVSGMHAEIENLATTAENSVANAVAAKNAAVDAKAAAETAAETAATAAAGIQSVVETDVDNTLTIPGVAADAKVTGDWLRDIAKPVTLDTSMPATAYANEYMKVTTDSEGRVLYGVKRDGTFTWQKGVPKHVVEACNPTIGNDEYMYVMLDTEGHVIFGVKRDGSVTWQKGTPEHVIEACHPTINNDEYAYVMLDADNHILFGVKKDGSFDWQKGLPKPVKEKLEEVAQTVIDSEEFVQLTQDSEGKLIEGVIIDGTKKFMAPVSFAGGVKWSKENLEDIKDGLFDYEVYEKANVVGAYSGLDILYLNGDMTGISKDNKVNLSYLFRGVSGTCTLKWQGASSIAFPKKNYTIAKMTPSVDVGWGKQKKYCLKADFADCSHARNVVSAKLWGGIVRNRTDVNAKLANSPNAGAVDGFPIMLVINGEYQGLYNFNIPKDPWMLDMGSGANEAMITSEGGGATNQFKATISKEDILAAKYWEIEYIPDEDNPDWAIDSFNRMLQACINSTGINYRDTLADYLDIESAIDYYIFCCLIGSTDGINHNMIMATYDGIKWFFNAYDLDWSFGNNAFSTAFIPAKKIANFYNAQLANRVFHLIYAYDKDRLKARYAEIRDNIMSEDNVLYVLSNFLAPIPRTLVNEEGNVWPKTPGTLTNNAEQIVNWYRLRVQYMDEEIANL